jgi:hypothetical protein
MVGDTRHTAPTPSLPESEPEALPEGPYRSSRRVLVVLAFFVLALILLSFLVWYFLIR